MSVRNGFVLLLAISALFFSAGCGGSNNITQGVAPPSGGFSNSNLNGTYVFSVTGTDSGGDSYALVGTFTANGSGGTTGGTVDISDTGFTPALTNASVSSGNYSVGADGRGTVTLKVSGNPFSQNIVLDFVLQDGSHGLVSEADNNATGSGTLDLETANPTPTGSYAFSFSGAGPSGALATVGNFTLGANGAFTGLEDFNSAGVPYPDEGLSGELVLGPSSTPSTVLTASNGPYGAAVGITFDVFAIDANHLKFIETDGGTLEGDAFAQTSTTIPTGNLAFTLSGFLSGGTPFGAGGYMVTQATGTDGSGSIVSPSSEDLNEAGSTVGNVTFSGTFGPASTDPANSGRLIVQGLSGFEGASEFVAYPSSGGTLLLEIDSSLGILAGAAYPPQSSTTFAASEGYGLNLDGINLATGNEEEVDDIAEFATASGGTISGVIDENFQPGGGPTFGIALSSGTYTTIDSNGRYGVSATASTSSTGTLNGVFALTLYSVDGTTFPFLQTDANGQVGTGVVVQQSLHPLHIFGGQPSLICSFLIAMVRARSGNQKKK